MAAFELARMGVKGGLYCFLKELCNARIGFYSQNEIDARITHYWNSLSTQEQFKITDKFLKKCGHFHPCELIDGSVGRIRANRHAFLAKYPTMIQQIQDSTRR
jgi:hypothetical protein